MNIERFRPGDTDLSVLVARVGEMTGALLTGEDPSTRSPLEARRWVSVYSELIRVVGEMIGLTRMPGHGDESGRYGRATPTEVLKLQVDLDRFTRRLKFWEGRLAELHQ